MSAGQHPREGGLEERRYLGRGVVVMRNISLLLIATGLIQVVLQTLGGKPALLTIGALQAACGLGLAYGYWLRAPQTRISETGLDVREGNGVLRHVDWASIAQLVPPSRYLPTSRLHLHDGSTLSLPGVDGDRAPELAALAQGIGR